MEHCYNTRLAARRRQQREEAQGEQQERTRSLASPTDSEGTVAVLSIESFKACETNTKVKDTTAEGEAAEEEQVPQGEGQGVRPADRKDRSPGKESPFSETKRAKTMEDEDKEGIVVLSAEELEDLGEGEAKRLEGLVKSEEWMDQYEATTLIRRLVRFRGTEADKYLYPFLEDIFSTIKASIDSLRSAQSRNALFCTCEMFQTLSNKELLVSNIGDLLGSLVLKGTNEKRFIAQAGEDAVEHVVRSAPSIEVLRGLLSFSSSKSTKVCALVAKHSFYCLKGLGEQDKLGGVPVDVKLTIVKDLAELAFGRSVPAKRPAQASIRLLAKHVEDFEEQVKKALPPIGASNVLSVLKKQAKTKEPRTMSLKEMMAKSRQKMAKQDGE